MTYYNGSGVEPTKPKMRKVRCYHCNGTGRYKDGTTICSCPYCKGYGEKYVEENDFHPGTAFIDNGINWW